MLIEGWCEIFSNLIAVVSKNRLENTDLYVRSTYYTYTHIYILYMFEVWT